MKKVGKRGFAWHRAVLTGVLTLLALGCRCAATLADDDGTGLAVGSPYSGKTAGDIQKGYDPAGKSAGDGTQIGVPGTGSVLKMLAWLGVVIVFIYAVVYAIRRYVPSARNMFGSGVLKVVGRTYISSKQCLLLVKVGSRFLVVGIAGSSMSRLAEISDPDEVKRITEELAGGGGHGIADAFRRTLERADGEYADTSASSASRAATDAELGSLREELDAVTEKMSWWRRHANG